MKIGFDTGFFVEFLNKSKKAVEIWQSIILKENEGYVNCLTFYEISIMNLKGKIKVEEDKFFENLKKSLNVIWINEIDLLINSSKMGYGNGFHAIDSIILESFIEAGCKRVYTVDVIWQNYKRKNIKIILCNEDEFTKKK